MTTLSIVFGVGIWVLDALQFGGSWAPLMFALRNVAKLLFSCLCLFDTIIKPHAMDE